MPTPREQRLADNESLFRIANERMAGWEEQHAAQESELYFCECADAECREKVRLTKPEYERVRSDSCQFALVPGHEILDVESVLETHEGWLMIRKNSEVSEIVEESDPRSG